MPTGRDQAELMVPQRLNSSFFSSPGEFGASTKGCGFSDVGRKTSNGGILDPWKWSNLYEAGFHLWGGGERRTRGQWWSRSGALAALAALVTGPRIQSQTSTPNLLGYNLGRVGTERRGQLGHFAEILGRSRGARRLREKI